MMNLHVYVKKNCDLMGLLRNIQRCEPWGSNLFKSFQKTSCYYKLLKNIWIKDAKISVMFLEWHFCDIY